MSEFPNGTFQSDTAVTRPQFLKMLVLTHRRTMDSGSMSFNDMAASEWFAPTSGGASARHGDPGAGRQGAADGAELAGGGDWRHFLLG